MKSTKIIPISFKYFVLFNLYLLSCLQLKAADFKVLVFYKTNGFEHTGAITAGIKMIEDLGRTNGWTTDNTKDAAKFTDANLAQYKVIVWANTSGNGLLNAAQQKAMEKFIQNGGGFVGIHAATDTYRDKSWPWYNDLVGAIVQTGPNHTANNTTGTMDVMQPSHEITSHLGTTWTKKEEWYYWDLNGGYIYNKNIDLLKVRSTGSNSYDRARPTTWYKEYDGGRSFYTALGHNGSDYVVNSDFGKLIKNAILWAAKKSIITDIESNFSKSDALTVYPNPVIDYLKIDFHNSESDWQLYNSEGQLVLSGSQKSVSFIDQPLGIYTLKIGSRIFKISKQ